MLRTMFALQPWDNSELLQIHWDPLQKQLECIQIGPSAWKYMGLRSSRLVRRVLRTMSPLHPWDHSELLQIHWDPMRKTIGLHLNGSLRLGGLRFQRSPVLGPQRSQVSGLGSRRSLVSQRSPVSGSERSQVLSLHSPRRDSH